MLAAEPRPELTERDIAYALYLLKVHVPLGILGTQVCRNCGWAVPCATRRLAQRMLVSAGLSELAFPDVVGGGQDQGRL